MAESWLDALQAETATIFVAVVSALLTTLVVEYFAKPKLEARKARLIRDRQQIDNVVFRFQRLALQIGAVPPADEAPEETLMRDEHDRQTSDLEKYADAVVEAISELSPSYAERHSEHLGFVAKHMGFITGLARRSQAGFYVQDLELSAAGERLEKLDVYFRVYVGMRDSQEPWVKRAFWRRFTSKAYVEDARRTFGATGTKG